MACGLAIIAVIIVSGVEGVEKERLFHSSSDGGILQLRAETKVGHAKRGKKLRPRSLVAYRTICNSCKSLFAPTAPDVPCFNVWCF